MPDRQLLGIDPGMARTGYGLIHESRDGGLTLIDFGVLTTTPETSLAERLLELEMGMERMLTDRQPDSAAVERLFFERNVTTAMSVGQARGVALATLARRGIPVSEYAPSEIKQAVAGSGSADKRQMQVMVRRLLSMVDLPRPDDAADALAVAICHAHTSRTLERLEAHR